MLEYIKTRCEFLMSMDKTMRNLNDEDFVMWWLEEGIEDHLREWTLEDYLDYAEDETYVDICDTFDKILNAAAKAGEEIPVEWRSRIKED